MTENRFKTVIQQFNKQLSFDSLKFDNLNQLERAKPDAIVIIGMGGSGQIGDLITGLRQELNIPVPVLYWKNFDLPNVLFKNPLYIFVSYSGNTEEVISGFTKAENKAVVTSGGKLIKLAKKQNIPLASFITPNIKPRQGSGFMYYGILGIIRTIFPQIKIRPIILINSEKIGQLIAKKISNKTVLLYSSVRNKYLAYNWKTRLNETAKTPAFCGSVPEICHNEIEIFENEEFIKKALIILIKDQNDSFVVKKRFNKLEKIIKLAKIKSQIIELKGKNNTNKAWNAIVLADWVSYYTAKFKKIDPAQTALIDKLKTIK